MEQSRFIRFRIGAYTPTTMPMARLAEYMAEFAAVLGERSNVHFERLEAGSTVIVQRIDGEAFPKIRERVDMVSAGVGPPDAMAAFARINNKLREDDGIGVVTEDGGAEIIRFPGREQEASMTFGPLSQEGTLDGVVIRLGGTRDPVPVHIQSGSSLYTHCVANRDLAKILGGYIFGPELRVHGTGRWHRDAVETWVLDRFTIASFEILGNESLSAVVAQLRDIRGSGWDEIDDPWSELENIRNGTHEAH